MQTGCKESIVEWTDFRPTAISDCIYPVAGYSVILKASFSEHSMTILNHDKANFYHINSTKCRYLLLRINPFFFAQSNYKTDQSLMTKQGMCGEHISDKSCSLREKRNIRDNFMNMRMYIVYKEPSFLSSSQETFRLVGESARWTRYIVGPLYRP